MVSVSCDAVRAYTKVDIFDEYYDKLGKGQPYPLN